MITGMTEWLRPLKLREYYLDHRFTKPAEADKQPYLAVISGEVRAKFKGRTLEPEYRKQLAKMETEEPFDLPPDLLLSVEDARRLWG